MGDIGGADLPGVLEATQAMPKVAGAFSKATGNLTVYLTSQAPHIVRTVLAMLSGIPESKIRVVGGDIGGGFGNKVPVYPGYVVAIVASIVTGVPVISSANRTKAGGAGGPPPRARPALLRGGSHGGARGLGMDAARRVSLALRDGMAGIFLVSMTLNLLVASIGSWQFWRAGHFRWRTFWPFALTAVPCAFVGGYLHLPAAAFKLLVGLVLLCSAAVLLLRPPLERAAHLPPLPIALVVGGALGLLAGLTGTGGGIYLTPLLIFMHWSTTRTAAAVSALFILLNSGAGLIGHSVGGATLPALSLPLAAAVVIGGTAGAWLGSRRLPQTAIKRMLAIVLAIAGLKMVVTA